MFSYIRDDVHDTSEDEACASNEGNAQERDARIECAERTEEDEQNARNDDRPVLFCFLLGSHSYPLSLDLIQQFSERLFSLLASLAKFTFSKTKRC